MRKKSLGPLKPEDAFNSLRHLPFGMAFSRRAFGQGTFTVICADPLVLVRAGHDTVDVTGELCPKGIAKGQDPIEAVRTVFDYINKEYGPFERGPFPFSGGAAGYFSYDLKDVLSGRNRTARSGGLGLPLLFIGFYDNVYVYDHGKGEAFFVDRGIRSGGGRLEDALERAASGEDVQEPAPDTTAAPAGRNLAGFTSNTTKEEHMAGIRKALDYISEGDIYQINLSHMLSIPCAGDPFALYRRVIEKSPAPYGAYLDAGSFKIISNSPERLLKVADGIIETSPIKGTRPRGLTPESDRRLAEELRKSFKERAEHVMIVDLERNDLGQVAVPGTVEVAEFERIETLPGLHHMVSTVRARLAPGTDAFTCLKAAFPGGSVTGAPKIRAMEIIDEIEKAPRSIYTGGIGWVDFSGSMDLSMAIRTAVYRGGLLHLNVGGGIVADSDPEAEYDETILKAKDFIELTKGTAGPVVI